MSMCALVPQEEIQIETHIYIYAYTLLKNNHCILRRDWEFGTNNYKSQ